jgi:hypothetical protein
MDYLSLAQLAKPGARPYGEYGGGTSAGLAYSQDQMRYQEAMRRATALAEMQAQAEANKAEELALGKPGRLADIKRKNLEAENALDTAQKYDAEARTLKAEGDAGAARQKLKDQAYAQHAELINAINDAETDEEVTQAIESYKMAGNSTKIGQADFATMGPKMAKKVATALFKGKQKTPQDAQKKELEELKGQSKLVIEKMKAHGAVTKEQMRIAANKELAKLKADLKPSLWKTLEEEYPDPMERLKAGLVFATAPATTRAAGDAAVVKAVTGGNVNLPQPTPPALPPSSKDKPSPKFKEGQVYVDKAGNKARYVNGKWEPVK